MKRKKLIGWTRKTLVCLVAICAALSFSGCPLTYEIVLGDWVFNFSTLPIGQSYGLTLNFDGSATPYESTPNGGILPGTWSWTTNGHDLLLMQNNKGNFFDYDGELLSDTSAAGSWVNSGNPNVILGQWQGVLDQ